MTCDVDRPQWPDPEHRMLMVMIKWDFSLFLYLLYLYSVLL